MRPQKVNDEEMIVELIAVFREKGFDGASMAELADRTGLKKASLYHRFPAGKQQMAEAVLQHLDEWMQTHVFDKIEDEALPIDQRISSGIAGIRQVYREGREACILRALSLGTSLELFEKQISQGMDAWLAAFENLGRATGFTDKLARAMAIQTLVEIQGSLVVCKGINDLSVFDTILEQVSQRYTNQSLNKVSRN